MKFYRFLLVINHLSTSGKCCRHFSSSLWNLLDSRLKYLCAREILNVFFRTRYPRMRIRRLTNRIYLAESSDLLWMLLGCTWNSYGNRVARGDCYTTVDGRGSRVRSNHGESERFYFLAAAARYILSNDCRLVPVDVHRFYILYLRDAHHLDTDRCFSSDRFTSQLVVMKSCIPFFVFVITFD